MAYEIIWSPRATISLTGIIEYVAADNPAAARRLAQRLIEHIEHLAHSPRMGGVYRRSPKREIRQMVEPPYRIFYRVDETLRRVVILVIWHAARREPRL